MTDVEIAAAFKCTRQVVKGWRRAYGIKGIRRHGEGIGAPRQFARPSKIVLQSLTDRKTDQEIADIYGCSRAAVRKWRAAYGLPKLTVVYRRRPWAYDLNEGFFAKINNEAKAYILGLLATDGCVADRSHSNRVFLCLQARDEHILRQVLEAMDANSPIHDRPKGSFTGSGPMKYIALSSRTIVADLARWGVTPRKSSTLAYAQIDPRFERHYVRGLFDGDGSVHPKKIFYFLGTERLIDGIIDAVSRHTGICLKKRKAGRLYRASGYAGSRKVLHWMYHRSKIFLERKKAIYEQFWS